MFIQYMVFFLALIFTIPSYVVADELKVGVLALRGLHQSHKHWHFIDEHLEKETGHTVKLIHFPPDLLMSPSILSSVDFMLANPVVSLTVQENHGFLYLATLNRAKTGTQFGGVIVTHKNSHITSIDDLKGKKVRYFRKNSAGAFIFQAYHLIENGFELDKDFTSFKSAWNQDRVLSAVAKGRIDAGFVRTGMIESMVRENKIKREDIVVLDEKISSFPYVHSTTLYPEWAFNASPKVDKYVAKTIKLALLKVKPSQGKKSKVKGFVEPVSMDKLKLALQALKMPPYDK